MLFVMLSIVTTTKQVIIKHFLILIIALSRVVKCGASLMSGVIETREALQAISEAEGEIQGIEDEDWKNFPLETEDMSKMEDVE